MPVGIAAGPVLARAGTHRVRSDQLAPADRPERACLHTRIEMYARAYNSIGQRALRLPYG